MKKVQDKIYFISHVNGMVRTNRVAARHRLRIREMIVRPTKNGRLIDISGRFIGCMSGRFGNRWLKLLMRRKNTVYYKKWGVFFVEKSIYNTRVKSARFRRFYTRTGVLDRLYRRYTRGQNRKARIW